MQRIYHRYEKWEDWKQGFYREIKSSEARFFRDKSELLLSDHKSLLVAMIGVVESWTVSAQHNLSNKSMNRIAWLGQAACAFNHFAPSQQTKEAWHKITPIQQKLANLVAKQALNFWKKTQYTMPKTFLNQTVLEAAKERISYTFDNFKKIYISFSGGKDSTVMMHLVMEEAIKRGLRVGVFFLDWECQFTITADHIRRMFELYKDNIDPYWICLPIMTDNACSQFETTWSCWDESKKDLWVREKEPGSISDPSFFPFFYENMTFEEFTPLFAKWYADGEPCANFVGIRTVESLNRFRALSAEKKMFDGNMYFTNVVDECWSVYPIYDWETQDIWTYNGKEGKIYNGLYDRMYKAGMSIHQMRIDEPFGDTSRKSLWLYQIVESKIWAKIVARVAGANTVNEYGTRSGNMLGNHSIKLPEGHTWQSFANFILGTMPDKTSEHYKGKIAGYIRWYQVRGYEDGIPDEAPMELKELVPCWKRICKVLLKNDYWCKGLGFSINKSSAYDKYLNLMRRRRNEWGIYKTN